MGWLLSSLICTSPVSSFNIQILLVSYVDETHPQPALCKRSAGVYGLTLTRVSNVIKACQCLHLTNFWGDFKLLRCS